MCRHSCRARVSVWDVQLSARFWLLPSAKHMWSSRATELASVCPQPPKFVKVWTVRGCPFVWLRPCICICIYMHLYGSGLSRWHLLHCPKTSAVVSNARPRKIKPPASMDKTSLKNTLLSQRPWWAFCLKRAISPGLLFAQWSKNLRPLLPAPKFCSAESALLPASPPS